MNDEIIQSFFQKLDALENKHRIRFKRNCGLLLNEVDVETIQTFYRILPRNISAWAENKWFAAACIHCLWKAEETNRRTMQDCIASCSNSQEMSESFEKRVTALLATQWEEDGFLCKKLERMAKLLKQKNYAVDGSALLKDLINWNHEDKFVQKQWIKTYWHMTESEN